MQRMKQTTPRTVSISVTIFGVAEAVDGSVRRVTNAVIASPPPIPVRASHRSDHPLGMQSSRRSR